MLMKVYMICNHFHIQSKPFFILLYQFSIFYYCKIWICYLDIIDYCIYLYLFIRRYNKQITFIKLGFVISLCHIHYNFIAYKLNNWELLICLKENDSSFSRPLLYLLCFRSVNFLLVLESNWMISWQILCRTLL